MINILYEDNHIIVVNKPSGLLSQSDITNEKDILTELKKMIKEKYQKPGNVYLGLIHRLDRPVSGVMILAKTSKAAARLSDQIRNNKMDKTYYAIVHGEIDKQGVFIDYLLKDSKTNKTKIDKKGKLAKLEYEKIACLNGMSLVKINLITGRSHQIRVQFSYHGFPLVGDHKYGINDKCNLALYSYQIKIIHPIKKEEMIFNGITPLDYPFNIFKEYLC